MNVVAITREMGSLGSFIGMEVARRLVYEFVRQNIIREPHASARFWKSGSWALWKDVPGWSPRSA